jgi:nucleoside-diphosphate-sugar epimerase
MTCALVTGATGMLGGHLVDALVEAGIQVRAYARPTSAVSRLKALPVEIVYGDATDTEAIRCAVGEADLVFHAAGYLTASSPFEPGDSSPRYRATHVDFTHALLAASLAAGVGRFVYVSSISVYDLDAPVPTDEDALLQPISAYGQSKLEAEQLVRAWQAKGMSSTIIRPCVIYGPGDRHFLPLALRLARLPVLPLVNGGRNLLDLVYARDVAELMLRASQAEIAIGRVYNAGPGTPTTLRELVAIHRRLTGHGPRIIPVSAAAIERSAWISGWFLARFAPEARALFSPTGLALMSQDNHLDMSRAEADLGFRPRYSLEQGVAATLSPSPGAR